MFHKTKATAATKNTCKQTAAAPAASLGSSRIAARADRSTASAVLAAGGGTARLLAKAGSCTSSRGKQKPSGQSYCIDPKGRAAQKDRSKGGCMPFSFPFSRAYHKILQKKARKKNEKTQQNGTTFSEKYEGPRTNQQMNAPKITCLDP